MRNRLWVELTQARYSIEYVGLYSDLQRKWLRYFNVGVLVFSTGGVMGWKVWEGFPVVVCVIIAGVSLLRLVQPHLIVTDKMLNQLDRAKSFYTCYYNELEKLWFDFDADRVSEEEATTAFYKIKDGEMEIGSLIVEALRSEPKKVVSKAKRHCDDFFKYSFNTKVP